jgi:hypothetical protein
MICGYTIFEAISSLGHFSPIAKKLNLQNANSTFDFRLATLLLRK